MKTRIFLSFLAFAGLLCSVKSQCDLTGGTKDVDFPDIMKNVADSYIMGVEYSVPLAKQTDYYTEYYEYEFKRGRIEGHQDGESFVYIYRADTWEAWNIKGNKCELKNITVVPDFFRNDMTDWLHKRDTDQFTTIGPSAMFKIAYDEWKKPRQKTMAYMGKINSTVRGEPALYFRRCLTGNAFVDYFFAAKGVEDAFDMDVFKEKVVPLRVAMYNLNNEMKELANQYYDIISFQHVIPADVEPFQLPKGKNCQRGSLIIGKKLPDFSTNSIIMSAEVVYQKISTKDDENELLSSYYSTFMFALDREINHLAYFVSSWNTSKPDKTHQEPFLNQAHYMIYDMSHYYLYKINYETSKCEISRDKTFIPTYKLPENGGGIALTDPAVLFPNNEFSFLSKGMDRGLEVNIFEREIKNYVLDSETLVERAIVSHSYLTDNEEVENAATVRSSPTQIELHLFRTKDIEEVLTFNIFGFSTRIPQKRFIFDIRRCFLNDDDYVYLRLGFEPEQRFLPKLQEKVGDIEYNVLSAVTRKSELNAVRIPYVYTDFKNEYIFVNMVILGKPPLQLDFTDIVKDTTIPVKSQEDTEGVSDFETCAQNCLEDRSDCWGFSLCGATCFYGSGDNNKVESKVGCTLYRRFSNETFIQSKELQVNNIVGQVEANEFITMVILDTGEQVQLKATSVQVGDPAEDDLMFRRMGNKLNPRMKVFKSATKLKKGSEIKNMGKLRYDECQKLCLDFKDCESLSYCLINSECILSNKYGGDLKPDELVDDNLCNLLTRKYADHFERVPGVFVSADGGTTAKADNVEDCARACIKQGQFKCLSFDHCSGGDKNGCRLYSTHFLNAKTMEGKHPRCGHYSRKFSVEFKKKDEMRILGGSFDVLTNLTMEECAKRCIEFGDGACYGFDFCQDQKMYATSCTLIDTDPSRLKSGYSPVCANYIRTSPEYAPRPYSNAYAGGIGFLCFIIGGVVGIAIIFAIAYFRANRG